jgi:site-specific DNA recombinase
MEEYPMKPTAAIYCRISQEDQSAFSLPSQEEACRKLADSRGFRTPNEYVFLDNGGLSTEIDRPALTALREAVRSGVVSMVVIYDLDRLARKLSHQLLLLDEFQKHGVPVEFCNAPTEATPEGRMLLTMRGMFSEYEREKIRERTVRGSRQRAKSGRVNSTPPYGYSANADGTLSPHAEHSKVVQSIFRWMIEGFSAQEIASRLNADCTPAPKRGTWIRGTVLGIANRRAYTGTLSWNKTTAAEPIRRRKPARAGRSKRTSFRRRDASEWIDIEIPALIDNATFEQAHAAIQANRRWKSGRPSRSFLFTGLIRCKVCKAAWCGSFSHGWSYYRCTGRDANGRRTCHQHGVRLEKMETETLAAIRDALTSPKRLVALVNGHASELQSDQTNNKAERADLGARIERLRAREFRARQGMLDTQISDSFAFFREELKAAQAQRRDLERRLESLAPARTVLRETDVAGLCRTARARFDSLSRERMRDLLRFTVDTIHFSHDDAEIRMAVDVSAALAVLDPRGGGAPSDGMTANCQAGQRAEIHRTTQ